MDACATHAVDRRMVVTSCVVFKCHLMTATQGLHEEFWQSVLH